MFTEKQINSLKSPLDSKVVKRNPKGFDYVEGWHAIAEANRIFGFDSWDRETLEMRQLGEPEQDQKGNWRVAYHCCIKIRVRAGDHTIVREGNGYGSGILKDIRDAHESAIKEAETDAMKRALMTFGNPFGLALYDKEKTNVASAEQIEAERRAEAYMAIARAAITSLKAEDSEIARKWWSEEKEARRAAGLQKAEVDELTRLLSAKFNSKQQTEKEVA